MPADLDHLVYATPDLPATVLAVERALGVAATPGGRHPGWGTANALLVLDGGAYLEMIGPDPGRPAPALPRPFGIDGLTGARLVGWAVRVADIDAALAAARAAGHDPGDVAGMGRTRPDGTVLSWRLTAQAAGPAGGVLPFLIDWGSSPHPADAAQQAAGLERFAIAHPDPDPVRAVLSAIGIAVTVTAGSAGALAATIAGPGGTLRLS